MPLPLRGLIDVTFGDQELMVDFLSANPFSAQETLALPKWSRRDFSLFRPHELQGVDSATTTRVRANDLSKCF